MEVLLTFYLPIVVVGFFFMLGTLGVFVPILPAAFLIWGGILLHKLWVPEHSLSWNVFLWISGLALLSQMLDWVFIYWGARKFGASWRGAIGALLGLIIAPFFLTPIAGIVLGPIIGAVVGELLGGRTIGEAGKAGLGAIIGGFLAFVFKLGIIFLMMVIFYYSVLSLK